MTPSGVLAGVAAGVLVVLSVACARAALLAGQATAANSRLAPRPSPRPRHRLPPPAWLGPRLDQAGVETSAEVAWSRWALGAGAGVVLGGTAGGLALASLCVGLAVAAPVLGWAMFRHRGQARLEGAVPGLADSIARGLRSGASLRQAVAEAGEATPGPLGDDVVQVATAVDRGATLVASLEDWARRRPVGGVRLLVAALCLGAETGGARAQAIDGVAATLRQRLAARSEARALATQARVSATVIALSPLAFCAVASATDARTSTFLLRTPLGLTFLAAGLALDAAGALWMARLTRVEP